jgi:outer membrane lipoprotein-sorting protein
VQAIEAEARAEQIARRQRVKVKVSVWAARPDRLRLEIQGPLGSGAATLVTDGTRFSLLDGRQGRLFTGAARGCNVARLVQVELEPAQAVAILLGDVPVEAGEAHVSWDARDGGREVLTIRTSDGGEEKLWLDGHAPTWDPLRVERHDATGHLLWRVEEADWSEIEGKRLPGRTTVRDERRGAEIRLRWKDRTLDPQLKDEGFRLDPPAGTTPEEVGCD